MINPHSSTPVATGTRTDPKDLDLFTMRREDAAAMYASFRRENRRPRAWIGLVTGMGGLLLAAVLITIGGYLDWPEVLAPAFLAGGWVIMLGSFWLVWRRSRQLRARFQIHCPACGEPLLDWKTTARVELAIATGNCSLCGAHFLSP